MGTAFVALSCVAMVMVTAVVTDAGAASSSLKPAPYAIIKFWPASDAATLTVPVPSCPGSGTCPWMLVVDEPDTPGQTVVGMDIGSSGVLRVNYPAGVCGTEIQADAFRGPPPWRLRIGFRTTVTTAADCAPTPPVKQPTVVPDAVLPPSAAVTTDGSGTGSTSAAPAVTEAAVAAPADQGGQLPFTGLDVGHLLSLGMSLVGVSVILLTTVEQRRQARRRLAHALKGCPPGVAVSRTSRWLLGL